MMSGVDAFRMFCFAKEFFQEPAKVARKRTDEVHSAVYLKSDKQG
jgi:hypothetical protein